MTSPATTLSFASAAGATNIKVASVEGFNAGRRRFGLIRARTSRPPKSRRLARQAPPLTSAETAAGATAIPVANARGFNDGQTIAIGSGTNSETAVIVRTDRFPIASITVSAPLTMAHAAGTEVSGTGITLTAPLTHEHAGERRSPAAPPRPARPTIMKRQRVEVACRAELNIRSPNRLRGTLKLVEASCRPGPARRNGAQQQTATPAQPERNVLEERSQEVIDSVWLPPRDSNPDMLIQSQLSYH